MDISHLSYSSVSSFLDCPRWWEFKYIQKQPTVPTPELFFGSVFHSVVEQYVSARTLGDQMGVAPSTLINMWDSQWKSRLETEGVDWGLEGHEPYFNDGLRLLGSQDAIDALNKLKAKNTKDGLLVEKKVELRVPGVPLPIIGYIDIVRDDGTPGDFKTSSRSWSDDRAGDELQPLFYLAALNQMGIPTPGYRFTHYVFVKTKTPKVQVIESIHNLNKIVFLFEIVREAWRAIEHEAFFPNPSSWKCSAKWCDFWRLCRGKFDLEG